MLVYLMPLIKCHRNYQAECENESAWHEPLLLTP